MKPAKGIFETIRRAVLRIPKGKVSTYGAVAEAAGLPGYARQVAWALNSPPVPLPWHRVVGAGGRISLPGASGMEQRLRLESEGVKFSGARVRMSECEFQYNRFDESAQAAARGTLRQRSVLGSGAGRESVVRVDEKDSTRRRRTAAAPRRVPSR